MRNRFAGNCIHCGAFVDKQKGHFHKNNRMQRKALGVTSNIESAWFLRCLSCVDRMRAEKELRDVEGER